MMLRPLALAALLLIAAADKPKQPLSQLPTLGETIEVSIVNVDVYVTDKAGNRVRGLTRDDFEVFENGQKQPLTNFAEYAAETSSAPLPLAGEGGRRPGEGPAPVDQKRNLVVFIERFRLPNAKADPMFAAMKKLLHDIVRKGDAAMVVTWDHSRLRTLQGYTDDVALLDKAVDSVAQQSTSVNLDGTQQTRAEIEDIIDYELELEEFAAQAVGAVGGDPEATVDALKSDFEGTKGMAQRMDALRARAEMQQKVRTLNALMRSMAGLDGKRVLIMATHRFSQIAGAEYFWMAGVDAQLESLDRIEFDTRYIVRSLYETANANGVTIYPMFPEGLGTTGIELQVRGRPGQSISPQDRSMLGNTSAGLEYLIQQNEMPALMEVAKHTGGLPAAGAEQVAKLLTTIRDDFDTYYSLAYRTTPRSLDKARSIVVKAKDPKLVIRSRREVIEKSDVTRMEDKVLASLFRPDENARLKFAVKLGDKQPRGKKYRIPVTIRIPIAALTTLQNGPNYSGGFSIYVAWGAKVGGISDATHRRQLFHIPAEEVTRAKRSFYTYQFDIAADGRTERISLGVVDEVSKEYGVRVYDLQ